MAPLALGVVVGSTARGRAPAHIGARWCTAAGFVIVAVGFLVLSVLGPASPYLLVGLVLLGLGTGFSSPAVTTTVLGAVPRDRAGMGSALNDTHQQLGIALGVAVIGGLLATTYRGALPEGVPAGAETSLSATLIHAAGAPFGAGLADTARAAFVSAQSVTMLVAAGCAAAGAALAIVVLSPDRPGGRGSRRMTRDPLVGRTKDVGRSRQRAHLWSVRSGLRSERRRPPSSGNATT